MEAKGVLLVSLAGVFLAWLLFLSSDRHLGYRKPSVCDLGALKARSAPLYPTTRCSGARMPIAWAMAMAGSLGLFVGAVAVWLSRIRLHIRLRLSK